VEYALEREQRVPINSIPKSKIRGYAILCTFGAIFGLYSAQLYISANQPCSNPRISELSQQKDVAARYDETADNFDSEVGLSEWLMGITKTRKQLTRQAHGHVLEVSCGTGRNLGYYDVTQGGQVESLTLVDLSQQMVDVCKKKWQSLYSSQTSTLRSNLVVRFVAVSALGQMPLAPTDPPKKYDTVIQTMGLCSTPAPVELLANSVQYLDTANPDARILLLEHGRSHREWLNRILDNAAEKHAEIHGCWFNRDIGALVAEAAEKTGLEVVKERRHHFGTTWVFELKPRTVPETRAVPELEPAKPVEEETAKQGRGWFGWGS
jgi:methyltransferase OMS1